MVVQELRGDHTQAKAARAIGWPYVVSVVVGLATFIAGWMSTAWLDHSQLQSLQFGRLDYVSSVLIVLAVIATTAVLRLDLVANVVAVACAILGLVISALGFDALASFGAVQDGTGIVLSADFFSELVRAFGRTLSLSLFTPSVLVLTAAWLTNLVFAAASRHRQG
jgi:hypothetical protein